MRLLVDIERHLRRVVALVLPQVSRPRPTDLNLMLELMSGSVTKSSTDWRLPVLSTFNSTILAPKPSESGECRLSFCCRDYLLRRKGVGANVSENSTVVHRLECESRTPTV
jgi:hypothetical protein